MTVILEPIIWSSGYSRPDDYYLIKDGQRIGRVCRMNTEMELWCWVPTGPRGSNGDGGVAYSLDEAEAAIGSAWERRVRGPQRLISMAWADKFAVALLAITVIAAAIVVPNLFGYSSTTESVGVAIGFFVGGAALFVLPLWLILRIAVWVTRGFGAEGAGGLPVSLVLEGLVHREDAIKPRLAGIKARAQSGITLLNGMLAKFPPCVEAVTKPAVQWHADLLTRTLPKLLGHAEAAKRSTVRWVTTLVNGTLRKLLGHAEAVTESAVPRVTSLVNGTLPKLLGRMEAATKSTVQWGIDLHRRSSLATLLPKIRRWRSRPRGQGIQDREGVV